MTASDHLSGQQFSDAHYREQEQFKTRGGAHLACGVSTDRFLDHEPAAERWTFKGPVRPESGWGANPNFSESVHGPLGHEAAVLHGNVVDWTARQFPPHDQAWPHVEPLDDYKKRWQSAEGKPNDRR
jgi:hypothetical protein